MNETLMRRLAKPLLFLAAFIWGTSFFIMKNTLDAVPPFWLLAFRFTTGAVLLGLVCGKRWRTRFTRDYLWRGGIFGLFLFFAYTAQTFGLTGTTPSKNAFLTATYCVLVPFLAWRVFHRRPDQYNLLAAFLLNAAWWLCCTLPLLRSYRQRYSVRGGGRLVRGAFRRLGETLREIRGNKQVFWFLVAFFLYIDGVYTIIDMATAYGQALGLDSTGLLLALLVTQIVAFPFALLFGWLSRKVDTALLVSVGILAYVGIAAYAIFLRTQGQFWVLAVCVGMFQGGIQSLSRSYFGKIIPPERSGEYYGLLDICGKGASFVGTFLVSALTQLSGSTSTGVMVIAPLILLGFFAFRRAVREGRKSNS